MPGTTDSASPFDFFGDHPVFVPYRLAPKEENPAKMDKIPSNGKKGLSTANEEHWMSKAAALKLVANSDGKLHGVGLVMTGGFKADGLSLIGIDFDGVDFDNFEPPFAGYIERSPGKNGLHMYGWRRTEDVELFKDSTKVMYPGCDHCEVYTGTSPRFLTITFDTWREGDFPVIDDAAWQRLVNLPGMNRASSRAGAAPLEVQDNGQPIDLSRFELSPDQCLLIEGKLPKGRRNEAVHGLLIKLLNTDEGTPENVLATMLENAGLWQYLLGHREAGGERAVQFAREEIDRAYKKSNRHLRDQLIALYPVQKSAEPKSEPEQAEIAYPPPFRGPLADVVNAALKVAFKPQPELTLLAVLISMAAACGSFYARANGSTLNLYGLGVLPTAAGKNAPLQNAKQLAGIGNTKLINAPASGEGLEDNLASNVGTLCVVDEIGHLIALTNSKNAQPHHASLMRKYLELFGAGSDPNFATRPKAGKDPRKIPNPALSVLGVTTPGVLGQALTLADIENGLAGRFLFVATDHNPKARLIDDRLAVPTSFQRAALKVECGLQHLMRGRRPILVELADGAQTVREALNDEFDQCGRGSAAPYEQALCARSMENLEHIAGTLAVWDNPDKPVITGEHLEWAAQFVRASNAAVLRFTETEMNSGDQQKNAAKLLKLLRKGRFAPQKGRDGRDRPSQVEALAAGMVPRSILLRESRLDTKELGYALDYLRQVEKVEVGRFADTGMEVVSLVNTAERGCEHT